ncbi:hypothetical protein KM043_003672 [Ampulex compressa]|nr:hypothetical protein KM043_003672 [Ampulex compressa]
MWHKNYRIGTKNLREHAGSFIECEQDEALLTSKEVKRLEDLVYSIRTMYATVRGGGCAGPTGQLHLCD